MPLLGTGNDAEYEDELNKIYGTQIMILCEGSDETKLVYEIRQKYQDKNKNNPNVEPDYHPVNQFKYDQ